MIAMAAPLLSTALLQLSLTQMTAVSTEIVQGTVTGSTVARSGNTIFTHYQVQVLQRWKGANNPTTDVAIPGGALQGVRQSFPGVPVLQTGQQYLLFLWQGNTGPNQPVGLTQGVFNVSSQPGGETTVFRSAAGEMMLNAAHQPVMDHPVTMRLSEMRSHIAAALAGGANQ